MNEFDPFKVDQQKIIIEIPMPGALMQNLVIESAHQGLVYSFVVSASLDWYTSDLAFAYKELKMEEIPELPRRPEIASLWPENGIRARFGLTQDDEARLKEFATSEGLTSEDACIKALTCYLFNVRTEELDFDEISSRKDHLEDESGFTRPKRPLPDPRDIGF